MTYETIDELEYLIFAPLQARYVLLEGHVMVVHRNPETGRCQWLAVNLYYPSNGQSSETDFGHIVSEINAAMAPSGEKEGLWPEPICTFDNGMGKTTSGLMPQGKIADIYHYYSFWLAVPPERHAQDFRKFFPAKRSS